MKLQFDAERDVRAMLDDMIGGFHRDQLKAQAAAAKANPVAHKDTNVISSAQYRCYGISTVPGYKHRFCWSKHRNVAGYYLSFTETISKTNVKRTSFVGWKTKREAMQHSLTRLRDAQKSKAERRYVLPKIKF